MGTTCGAWAPEAATWTCCPERALPVGTLTQVGPKVLGTGPPRRPGRQGAVGSASPPSSRSPSPKLERVDNGVGRGS